MRQHSSSFFSRECFFVDSPTVLSPTSPTPADSLYHFNFLLRSLPLLMVLSVALACCAFSAYCDLEFFSHSPFIGLDFFPFSSSTFFPRFFRSCRCLSFPSDLRSPLKVLFSSLVFFQIVRSLPCCDFFFVALPDFLWLFYLDGHFQIFPRYWTPLEPGGC